MAAAWAGRRVRRPETYRLPGRETRVGRDDKRQGGGGYAADRVCVA